MKKNKLLLLLPVAALLASCGVSSPSSSSSSSSSSQAPSSSSSQPAPSSESSQPQPSSQSSDPATSSGSSKSGDGSKSSEGSKSGPEESSSAELTPLILEGVNRIGVGRTTALVASEPGVSFASSNPEIATVDNNGVVTGVAEGVATITASKVGCLDASIEITVVLPLHEEGALSIYEDSFVSAKGELFVGLEGASYTDRETDKETVLIPTAMEEVEYSYKAGLVIKKETLPTLVFGPEYNDETYRLHLSTGERKTVILEKEEDGAFVKVDELIPNIREFAGSFNGLGGDMMSSKNLVYLFTSEFDEENEGFPIRIYYQYDLYETRLVNKSFYVNVDGTYLKVIDSFDLSDGAFFDIPVIAAEEGLAYLPESLEDDLYTCWYPDLSPILNDMVDDEGGTYYFDYDYDDGLSDWVSYAEYSTYTLLHDPQVGYSFAFTSDEDPEETLEFVINADYFYMETADTYHLLGRRDSFFAYSFADYGGDRTFTDGEHSIHMALDIDWDTWETIDVFEYDGESLDAKLVALYGGKAALSFETTEDEVVHSNLLVADNDYLGHMITDGESSAVWFDGPYYTSIFAGSYFGFNDEGDLLTFEVTEDLTVTDGVNSSQGKFVYNAYYESIFLSFGEEGYVFAPMLPELGLYVILDDEENVTNVFLNEDLASSLQGNYVLNGKNILTYALDKITYKGVDLDYQISSLSNGDGTYTLVFFATFEDDPIYFLVDLNGAFTIWSNSGTVGTAIKEEYWREAFGNYVYCNDDGELEYLILSGDGTLSLTTYNAETGDPEMVDYNYTFGFDEKGNLVLYVITEKGTAAFTKTDLGFTIGNITYLSEDYYVAQGTYYNAENNFVITVDGDKVYVNGVLDSSAKFTKDEETGATQIVLSDGAKITYGDGESGITYRADPEVAGSLVEFTLTNFRYDLADYVGSWTNGDDTYTLELTEFGYQMKKNGAFFASSYVITIVEGHVCITFKTPFGSISLYLEDGAVKAIIEGSSLPPAPPAPSIL